MRRIGTCTMVVSRYHVGYWEVATTRGEEITVNLLIHRVEQNYNHYPLREATKHCIRPGTYQGTKCPIILELGHFIIWICYSLRYWRGQYGEAQDGCCL